MSKIIAGGGVVWRPAKKNKVEILLVHRPNYRDWTFPKGKQDAGESIRMTARREVAEETNLHCRLGPFLGIVEYETGRGNPKDVHMWAMPLAHGSFKPNSEVDQIKWVDSTKVTKFLTYRRDREFYDSLGDEWWQKKPKVFVIRHAEAGNRRTWTGDDRTRPLSEEGRLQGLAIAERYADQGLERIVSSPYARCVQTVEALSAATGIEIEHHEALAEGADPRETARLINELLASRAAICSHGDVITDTLSRLAKRGLDVSQPFELKKGSTWKLTTSKGELAKARYEPPPTI